MLNKTDLAAPLGISVPTVTEWLGTLEATGRSSSFRPSTRISASG
jgi:hypothetical protein